MSHVTDTNTKIRNTEEGIACLEAALPPELELRRKKSFAWWGRFEGDSKPPDWLSPKDYGRCEYAIGHRGVTPRTTPGGPWEIGVVKHPDGDLRLVLDTFGHPGAMLSQHVNGIRQRYAAETIELKAAKKLAQHGWKAERIHMPGGTLRVRLRKR